MDMLKSKFDGFSRSLEDQPLLMKAEEATGLSKVSIVGGGGGLLTMILFFMFGPGLLSDIIGLIYPVYGSFLAIESNDKDDDTQWLTYWVIYALFDLMEVFADILLFWFPFYHAFKLGFLIWCYLPSTQGATFMYKHVVRPMFDKYSTKVESAVDAASAAAFKGETAKQE